MRGFFVDGKSYCLVFLNQFCATGLIQLFLFGYGAVEAGSYISKTRYGRRGQSRL